MRISFLLFSIAIMAFAQVDTGSISGTVTDKTGAVIPGASVTVTETSTNYRTSLATNEAGFYSAPSLHPGNYEVAASKDGFRPAKSRPFDLRVQDRAEMNFQLELGATTSEITVSASMPLLESETSSLGQVYEQKSVADLPLNGRNFVQLATLTAGALPSTRTAERDNFISNGARAIQNSYLLDGVDNKNRIFGFDKGSAQIISPMIDSIQEFKVQTRNLFGGVRTGGGRRCECDAEIRQQSYHGNVLEFLRNSKMDATPFFQGVGGPGKGQFIQNQYGATFGGRIIKDRTFFFGAWQSSREVNDAAQVSTLPSEAMRAGIFGNTRIYDPNRRGRRGALTSAINSPITYPDQPL